ncbi:MAG: RHS repeat-associated core domain-containing protein [Weeksellaceae bacterium]
MYRKYILTHDYSSLGQERLRTVDVENKVGQSLKSLNFNYSDTESYEIEQSIKSNAGLTSMTEELGNVTMGDFEGDGNISAIYVLKEDGANKLVSSKRGTLSVEDENYNPKLYTGKIIDSTGKVSERDQLLTINENFDSYTIIDGNYYALQRITFNFKDLVSNEESSFHFKLPQGFELQANGWCDEHYGDLEFNVQKAESPRYFLTGDFNSDGLIDIIVHQLSQTGSSVENPIGTYCENYDPLIGETDEKVYFLELGKLANSNAEMIDLSLYEYLNNGLENKEHYIIEFDGDGIPDILQLNKTTQKLDVLKLDHLNKTIETTLSQFELENFTDKTPLILGDYNGDGLTDFLTPNRIFELTQDNKISKLIPQIENSNHIWLQYLSNGTTFISSERNFSEQGLAHCAPSTRGYVREGGSFWKKLWSGPTIEYDYSEYGACAIIPIDFNNDGKTDLATFKKFGKIRFEDRLLQSNPQNINMTVTEVTGEIDQEGYDYCMQDCYYDAQYNGGGTSNCANYCADLYTPSQQVETQIANRIIFLENTYDQEHEFSFESHEESSISVGNKVISPFSFFINSQENGGLDSYRSNLILHDPHQRKDHVFSVNSKEFFENRINEINNGSGVVQQVEYTPLQKTFYCNCSGPNNENCQYSYNPESLDLPFPYFIHKQVLAKFMVSKINTLFDDKSITKEYRYESAVQHLDGKGFLGFQKTFISDPYESKFVNDSYFPKNLQDPVFWNINVYDPLQENQLVETRYGELGGDYFTRSQLSYTKYVNSDFLNTNLNEHQYIYRTAQEVNHDRIKDITITKTFHYDELGDLLLLNTDTDYNGQGSSTTTIDYKDAWSVGDHYYNGKILSISETINAYNDTFTTSDEYSDFNDAGIALRHEKYGNNTSAITTEVTYNAFGNKTSETVSADGIAPLTTRFEYDSTERFVTSITNPEGQTATKTVDIYGKTLTETSVLGLTQEHYYDDWGNPTYSVDYLENETHLVKENLGNGFYTLTTTTPGEPQTIVTFDKFDRQVKAKTQSINGKWSVVDTEYDIFGKKIRASEPYFDNESPTLWNTTEYDELDRPIKQTHYTGKIITTCYNGMEVSVDDGEQKTSKTLDVFGNVTQHKDHGGEIAYSYFPNGTLKEANYDGVVVSVEQDGWGNKTRLEDPSAGVYEYTYDALGRKLTETTPKGTTTYTYDEFGKLLYEITEGDQTNLSLQYEYHPNTKLPTKIYGYNGKDNFEYETKYDNFYRIEGKIETTPFFTYETTTSFDDYGRPEVFTTETTVAANAQTITTHVRSFYDTNGLQTQLLNDDTNQVLWEIDEVNAKGQMLQMQFGNGYQINQGYDNFYMPQSFAHTQNNQTALSIDYTFDAQKGILTSRSNHVFNKHENFEYDDLYRLTKEILNGNVLNEYGYDKRGRIIYNSQVGEYQYNDTDYQVQQIGFNATGQQLADERGFHNIIYNSYKKAVSIHLPGKERIGFDYNPFKDRIAMYYGSEDEDINLRPLRKYYSSDKAIEIKHNLQTGEIEVLTYLDGDPYNANVLQRNFYSSGNNSPPELWYLHRDYQSTILAITNQAGSILEQRYFDAWGNLKELNLAGTHYNQSQLLTFNYELLTLDRGYTGHEHLWGVNLVHMNGRLYDAKMRRFLSPDNFIQNPYDTQNFNRYGYVLNNPLIYTDPSGEILGIAALTVGKLLLGVAAGVSIKAISNLIAGNPFWYGLGQSAVSSLVSSYIGAGTGAIVSDGFMKSSTYVGRTLFKAGISGISGGIASTIQGGSFESGFASGVVSSLVLSGVQALGIDFSKTKMIEGKRVFALNKFGESDLFKVLQVAASGLSGGLSSTIAGGSFGQGVMNGLISSGVNSIADIFLEKGSGVQIPKKEGTPEFGPLTVYDMEYELFFQENSNEETQINLKGGNFDKYSKLVSGLSLYNTTKEKIIEWATKDGDLLTGDSKSLYKGLKIVGKGFGFYGMYDAGTKLIENPNSAGNWVRFGVNTFTTFGRANPAFFIGMGILDATGVTESAYNWIDNNLQ